MSAPDIGTRLEAWLLLGLTPGLPRRLHRICRELGSPLALIGAAPARLAALGLGTAARSWLACPDLARIRPALRWLQASESHALLCFGDAGYPPLLAQIDDPPPVLFVAGRRETLALPHLAVVGARSASPGGRETARALAGRLADAGFAITSGLAVGIDAAAHEGALEAAGRTTAVLATGPDRTYPAGHATLAARIGRSGCLVSEFPPGTPAVRSNFPRRNRIISGLSVGTLVVEAAERSGSLITARLAAEQGREVFAVPGSIHNPLARGCHQLLRDGAVLVECAEDVVAALPALLGSLAPPRPPGAGAPAAASRAVPPATPPGPGDAREGPGAGGELSSETRLIVEGLGYDPVSIDDLVQRAGLTADRVCSILALLEVQGLVQRLADGRYARTSPPGSRPR